MEVDVDETKARIQHLISMKNNIASNHPESSREIWFFHMHAGTLYVIVYVSEVQYVQVAYK